MKSIESSLKSWLYDPRVYQIAVLTSLLVYGIFWLDFEIRSTQAITILITILLTQYLCTRVFKLPEYDPRSPLISGLSLCLLLRTNSLLLVGLTAFITILSKFTLRFRGKHIFNPTNFGIVLMILLTDKVWVSPGQWGNIAFFGFLIACLGGLVVNRASRSDVTYAFLGFYISLLLGRASWLGDPLHIPLHQIQSGAFLVFTFFMISDPKTTPDSRAGRVLFAFLVAAGAFVVPFVLFRTNGLLWALAFFSLSVPLIDRFLPGNRYKWSTANDYLGANQQVVNIG
ncbi:MAG: RnfABCDGE type electron transport complex subunit D [Deltaproteobacteria bacterium]|nr:RnfABCDGE type electron transport complex subunit D [Deltaproteobacteria bacterium]